MHAFESILTHILLKGNEFHSLTGSCINYIPNSRWFLWHLVIGNWAFGYMELTPIICLTDHQAMASQCAIPNAESKLHWISYIWSDRIFICFTRLKTGSNLAQWLIAVICVGHRSYHYTASFREKQSQYNIINYVSLLFIRNILLFLIGSIPLANISKPTGT